MPENEGRGGQAGVVLGVTVKLGASCKPDGFTLHCPHVRHRLFLRKTVHRRNGLLPLRRDESRLRLDTRTRSRSPAAHEAPSGILGGGIRFHDVAHLVCELLTRNPGVALGHVGPFVGKCLPLLPESRSQSGAPGTQTGFQRVVAWFGQGAGPKPSGRYFPLLDGFAVDFYWNVATGSKHGSRHSRLSYGRCFCGFWRSPFLRCRRTRCKNEALRTRPSRVEL